MAEELKSNAKEDMPIRQNLVDTAVNFLLNPSVKQRPDEAKIAFLKKKALTDSEIAEAFNRVRYETETATASNEDTQLVNAYPLPPYQMSNSFWFHLRNYSSTFVSFAVAVYVLHRFYKSYIEPWLFGSKSEKSEICDLKQQLIELNSSVSRLTSTVASLEEAVSNQIHKIDMTSLYGDESVPKSVKDILDEVSNVKGLLLNRFSFPAPPTLMAPSSENKTQNAEPKTPQKVATIPKWQLLGSEHGKSKENVDESEDKEKSSPEPCLENGLISLEDHTQSEENNVKIANERLQNEVSKTARENIVEALEDKNENSQESLENSNFCLKSKMEADRSKADVEDQVNIDEKTLDEDSDVESYNFLSDSKSTDQTNKRTVNGLHIDSTKN